jgi:hypothetical protein
MIGRYTMGARRQRGGWRNARARRRGSAGRSLSARDHFEDFEFLAVLDRVRDGNRGARPHDDDGVGPDAFGAKDFLDGGLGAVQRNALAASVKPSAHNNFGRNPSSLRGGANA